MTEQEKKEFEEFQKWKAERIKLQGNGDSPEESHKTGNCDSSDSKEDNANRDKQKEENKTNVTPVFAVAGVFLILLFVFFIATKGGNNKSKDEELASISTVDSYEREKRVQELTDSIMEDAKRKAMLSEGKEHEWNFQIETDAMTDSKNIWASIVSDNSTNLGSPYGRSYCRLTVRYMKKWGYDVLVQLTSGQIHGSKYHNENYVMARFDEEQPIKYWFDEAADASSDCVFIRKKSDFISRCKKTKSIKLEVPIFQGGRPVFTFEVSSPLVWKEE